MKKGQIVTGIVERVDFPNKGRVRVDDQYVVVKNTLPGQVVECQINKIKHKQAEGRLLSVVEKSDIEIEPACPHFAECGGCTFQNLPYEKQLELKGKQVYDILSPVIDKDDKVSKDWYEGIKPSPMIEEYRNKMEFTFGDEYKDGPLALGMHKRGSFYDIVTVNNCKLVHEDFRKILMTTLSFFQDTGLTHYHRIRHEGYLRHLLVRRGVKTGEILICLVTTTQIDKATENDLLSKWSGELVELLERGELKGSIAGILHTRNDSLADIVQNDGTDVIYGQDFFYEELLGLKFKITPFSFFQTNSMGAQVLYETAREFALNAMNGDEDRKPVIFDLYSGTGTIAQMMAPVADKVIGVEIVEEASRAAVKNAEMNGLHNCEFIAGDVLKVLDELCKPEDKPDFIILDPPRDGCHPKALPKIIAYGVENMVYISCKVTSLARDLAIFKENGYHVTRAVAIDQFPQVGHVETVCLLSKK